LEIFKLNENVYQFRFVKEKSTFPFNITVFIDGNSALIIDVAYEIYAEQVKQFLLNNGVNEYIIFISHHHEDHFDGCKSFLESITYASKLFQDDYQEHLETDEYLKSFVPSRKLVDGDLFTTKKYEIEFIYTPGHNKCEYSFLINSKYLYVGDLIYFNKEGLPSLPYIDVNSKIEEYIFSLERIKSIRLPAK
jgi:glyoxylase-like metal-dependent hydrolase (beta-lactamase superfamily II)